MCLCLLSICFWRASLKKQNRKIHWHFESWIHRRCCLQCAKNIRFKQPEQAWCQAVLLGEKEEVWSSPFRIISNSAAAVWVWLCTSCSGRPALTLGPWGISGLSLNKRLFPWTPKGKSQNNMEVKRTWSFWRLYLREQSRKETWVQKFGTCKCLLRPSHFTDEGAEAWGS